MRKYAPSLIIVLNIVLATCEVHAQTTVINGKVLSQGRPVENATVNAVIPGGGLRHPIVRVLTGPDGAFTLRALNPGSYILMPWKQDEGVPDPLLAIFEPLNATYLHVQIEEKSSSKTVSLELPSPFGSITCNVLDAETKRKIGILQLTLRRQENQSIFYSTTVHEQSKFTVHLPKRPIKVIVSADGYQEAMCSDSAQSNSSVTLKSGEKLEITLLLKKTIKAGSF